MIRIVPYYLADSNTWKLSMDAYASQGVKGFDDDDVCSLMTCKLYLVL